MTSRVQVGRFGWQYRCQVKSFRQNLRSPAMGGIGSGTWLRLNKRLTTEQLYSLDVNRLARDGMLCDGTAGVLFWLDADTGHRLASASYSSWSINGDCRVFEISYRWNNRDNFRSRIQLQATQPHFSGQRWWFTCPLSTNGVPCNRRAAKLYLFGGQFGCRHCHNLTYRSCQESHQLERMCKRLCVPKMNWKALREVAS